MESKSTEGYVGSEAEPQSVGSQPLADSQVDLWSPDINLETTEHNPFAIEQLPQEPVEKKEFLLDTQGSTEDIQPTEEKLPKVPKSFAAIPLSQSAISTNTETASTSFVSALSQPSQGASRLNPVPPYISPIHFQLPTRRWTDVTVFYDVPFVDLLSETVSKAFASQSASQRPTRPIVVLEQALEHPDPYVPLIKSKRYLFLMQLESCRSIG
jgi:hypothetical protein